jgi:acyl-CoA thioester hydrolase
MREHGRMPRHRVFTQLRWSDMDIYGHVNNVQFLRLLEEARVLALSEDMTAQGGGTGLLVARSEIEYLSPLVFRPEPIAVDLWVPRIGAVDFDMAYEVLDVAANGDGPPQVYARAQTSLVAFDLSSERPRRITSSERARLEGWADGPQNWRRRR